MKKILFAFVLCVPCLLVLNGSEHIWLNMAGMAYIGILYKLGRTSKGRAIWRKIEAANEKILSKLLK